MKKRYWILEGLYTIEMVMIEQMYFEYNNEWRYRDDNYYQYANANVGYEYYGEQYIVKGYERTLIRIPCMRFTAKKVELLPFIEGLAGAGIAIKIYEITQDFDVRTVTWNNQPPHANLITEELITQADYQKFYAIDITESILSWFDRYTHPPSYKLIARDEGVEHEILREVTFTTERGVEAWRPKLNIIF